LYFHLPLRQKKPLNRALSFMHMDEVLDEDEEDDGEGNGPACKKPRLADEIGSELDTALRVVPQQTATSNQLVLVFYCKYMFVFER